MVSELFDDAKGKQTYGKRTICEVNREIYDVCVLGLHGKDDVLLNKIVPLLEESYMMGVRMNIKLIQHKDGNDEWAEDNMNAEQIKAIRSKRVELIKMMESQKIDVDKYDKNKIII